MSDKTAARFDLRGKVILVTGGSRGLGLAMARGFAAHGAGLMIASRKLDNCRQVANDIAAEFGVRAEAFQYHAGHWQDAEALLAHTLETFGRIDVLVNNAGASPLYPSLEDISETLWDKVIALNLKGPFRLSVLAAKEMAAAGGGSIINLSSVGAMQPSEHELPYAMAKSALHTMSAGLAQAYQGKVRVNVIMPGAFLTDISTAWPEAFHQKVRDQVPMGRAGSPDEIVGAAIYLASDASSYTSGAVIKVDGGWSPRPG